MTDVELDERVTVLEENSGNVHKVIQIHLRCSGNLSHYCLQQSCGKVMFSLVCVKNSVHRGHAWQGTSMAGGMHSRGHAWSRGACMAGCICSGGHAWWGTCVAKDVCGRGHVWQWGQCLTGGIHCRGECVAGAMCGRGHAWQGTCIAGGMCGWGACVAGEMAIAASGTHSTGMYSCFHFVMVCSQYFV